MPLFYVTRGCLGLHCVWSRGQTQCSPFLLQGFSLQCSSSQVCTVTFVMAGTLVCCLVSARLRVCWCVVLQHGLGHTTDESTALNISLPPSQAPNYTIAFLLGKALHLSGHMLLGLCRDLCILASVSQAQLATLISRTCSFTVPSYWMWLTFDVVASRGSLMHWSGVAIHNCISSSSAAHGLCRMVQMVASVPAMQALCTAV
jgi:hypothetical protein